MHITIDNISDVYKAKRSSVETMELKGYELVRELFVDSSGFGGDNEPALTANQFENELEELLTRSDEYSKLTAKITGVGQFQVYVGLFKKTGKKKAKKIANNTLLIDHGNGKRAIRLHDTDVLTEENGFVTYDNGGYATRTTHDRMNKYGPAMVNAKDFETMVNGEPIENGKTKVQGGLRI